MSNEESDRKDLSKHEQSHSLIAFFVSARDLMRMGKLIQWKLGRIKIPFEEASIVPSVQQNFAGLPLSKR